jgi:rhodanese-related sulfurtransferase
MGSTVLLPSASTSTHVRERKEMSPGQLLLSSNRGIKRAKSYSVSYDQESMPAFFKNQGISSTLGSESEMGGSVKRKGIDFDVTTSGPSTVSGSGHSSFASFCTTRMPEVQHFQHFGQPDHHTILEESEHQSLGQSLPQDLRMVKPMLRRSSTGMSLLDQQQSFDSVQETWIDPCDSDRQMDLGDTPLSSSSSSLLSSSPSLFSAAQERAGHARGLGFGEYRETPPLQLSSTSPLPTGAPRFSHSASSPLSFSSSSSSSFSGPIRSQLKPVAMQASTGSVHSCPNTFNSTPPRSSAAKGDISTTSPNTNTPPCCGERKKDSPKTPTKCDGRLPPCATRFKDNLGNKRIDGETLSTLLNGGFVEEIDKFIIIDSRYDYEYDGGHIRGAVNINQKAVIRHFFEQNKQPGCRVAVIFHCEFSQARGPRACSFFRSLDRAFNSYPHLSFPDLCVLEGGYKVFQQTHPQHCTRGPEGIIYVQMWDKQYADMCKDRSLKYTKSWDRSVLKKSRARKKTKRAVSRY